MDHFNHFIILVDYLLISDLLTLPVGSCSVNSSLEWILMNLAGFSSFATVQEMYLMNTQFDAVSIVPHVRFMKSLLLRGRVSATENMLNSLQKRKKQKNKGESQERNQT